MKSTKQLTISDIAKLAGVSKTTVSFILNGKSGVSEKTKEKVLRIIEENGFRPSLNSKRLFYNRSYTVAVVFEDSSSVFDNMFYFSIMKTLLKRCLHYGYSLIYSEFSFDGEKLRLPEQILSRDVDGLIFLKDIPQSLAGTLGSLGIPFVVVDDHSSSGDIYSVKADYEQAAYTAVEYLLAQGHRKIGFIGNTCLPAFYTQILSGYQKALRGHGLNTELRWFFDGITDRRSLTGQIDRCVCEDLPTAFFCMEDILAIELMKHLKSNNIRIPEDVSVVSVDDIIMAEYTDPALTTVSLDKEHMATAAIDLLIALIENRPAQSVQVSSNNLIVRDSVKKLHI